MFLGQTMVKLGIAKLYEIIKDRLNLPNFESKFHFIAFVSYFTKNIRYLADKVFDLVSWSIHGQCLMFGIIPSKQGVTL